MVGMIISMTQRHLRTFSRPLVRSFKVLAGSLGSVDQSHAHRMVFSGSKPSWNQDENWWSKWLQILLCRVTPHKLGCAQVKPKDPRRRSTLNLNQNKNFSRSSSDLVRHSLKSNKSPQVAVTIDYSIKSFIRLNKLVISRGERSLVVRLVKIAAKWRTLFGSSRTKKLRD